MRIAVLHCPTSRREALSAVAKAIARGLESQGHQVSLFDATVDTDARLSSFEYLVVGSEPASLMGKVNPKLVKFLSGAGSLAGKRSLAFILKPFLFTQRACLSLMAAMEAQGMIVTDYAAFTKPEEAAAFAAAYRAERY
jgi:menaquinone-dependent protoporphyrinogen IX oxidase